jgi:hypothetical protein
MDHTLIKIGAAFVLGGALFACPAYALSPWSLNGGSSLVVPAGDVEDEEVMRDMRPDEMPAEETGGTKDEAAPEGAKESGSGNVEDEEIYRDLETGVTPPPGE